MDIRSYSSNAQAAIVSEPLRSIKQMASYWDLKWMKTMDVCFAHVFLQESPALKNILMFQNCRATLNEDIRAGCIKWSVSCVICHVFFCGDAQGLPHKVVSPPWYVWCYGHMKENTSLQSVWSRASGQSITWSQRIYAVSKCTLQSTGFVICPVPGGFLKIEVASNCLKCFFPHVFLVIHVC